MKRSNAFLLLLFFLFMASCGSSTSSGDGKLYNGLVWADGSSVSATLSISDISMSASSWSWSSVVSSTSCGGYYTAVLLLDGENYGSTSLPFECNVTNSYTVKYTDQVAVIWENGGANRTVAEFVAVPY